MNYIGSISWGGNKATGLTIPKDAARRASDWYYNTYGKRVPQDIAYSAWKRRGSSGAGGANSDWAELIDEYQKAYEEAKKANEERYQDILKGYEDRYSRAMEYIESRNLQGQEDIASRWEAEAAKGQQDLTDRGFAGTTVLPTMRMGYEREKEAELRRLENDILQQKLGTDAPLSGDILAFKERREDEYPGPPEKYWELLKQSGQYGGMPSYSSGGGYGVNLMRGSGGRYTRPMRPSPTSSSLWGSAGTLTGGRTPYYTEHLGSRSAFLKSKAGLLGYLQDQWAPSPASRGTAAWLTPGGALTGYGNVGLAMDWANRMRPDVALH